jgi:hypothetical protein
MPRYRADSGRLHILRGGDRTGWQGGDIRPHQNRTVRNLPPDAMALFAGYLKVPLAVAKLARAIQHE